MGFRFLVWNVEKFQNASRTRTRRIAEKIYEHNPDVFGIVEFKAKSSARSLAMDYFPDYDFAFTDSRQKIEVLVGWRHGRFKQVLYTQRRDLAASQYLRPGGLISFQQRGDRFFHNILFLHLDSGVEKKDYKNRQEMFKRIWELNSTLKRLDLQNNKSKLIALGDLNTMGREEGTRITATQEINKMKRDSSNAGMKVLRKSHDYTWKGNSNIPDSNLDHVIASNDLKFETWKYEGESKIWEIEVDGWNRLQTETERRRYAREVSDHSPLIGEVID